jgi:AcrR family transcriptional regulator
LIIDSYFIYSSIMMETNNTYKVSNRSLVSPKDSVKERILEHSRSRFFEAGFTKVTMDELSTELGISKKTMYNIFPGKDNLLDQVIEWQLIEMKGQIFEILHAQTDFITRIADMWTAIGRFACRISKQFMDDIRKQRPDLWKRIDESRQKILLDSISGMIEEGRRLGLIRNDIHKDVVILMYVNAIQGVVNPTVLSQYSFSAEEAFRTILLVYLGGIMTDKARTQFIQHIAK